jgi:hypothetical protein
MTRLLLLLILASSAAAEEPPRHKSGLAALAGAVGFAVAANVYDARETERGLRLGVAVEGNTFLVGTHPSARALYLRDIPIIGLASTPSILGYVFRSRTWLFAGLVGGPGVVGVKHIQGGRAWARLIGGRQ